MGIATVSISVTAVSSTPSLISISIGEDGFYPVGMKGPARWDYYSATRLTSTPADSSLIEPDYTGANQLYGRLLLGIGEKKEYHFVLDHVDASNPILYFDKNQNMDLIDDGGPLTNRGTGVFARNILIPIDQVLPGMGYTGEFKIWFFTNNSLWEQGKMAHYCRT